MRLSPTTAGQYVDQLIQSGHLRESGLEQGALGRPKRMLTPVPDAGWFAGIEFNAERIQGVRVDFNGAKTQNCLVSLPEAVTAKAVLTEISKMVSTLAIGASGPMLGIGVGVPGVVDPVAGIAREYAFIEGWQDLPVTQLLQEAHAGPVTMENNLRAIALAERWFGGAQELADYAIFGPRSGLGVAFVIGGRLVAGSANAAGEVGRWPWDGGGDLHDALSSPAVWRRFTGSHADQALPADLHTALLPFAQDHNQTWTTLAADYARVLSKLHLLLDTHTWFLHGPLTALGDDFCRAITQEARRIAPALRHTTLRLKCSMLGDDAGALGAASLAMEAWRPQP
jgi:predicted NBD/HSP70 family sugar kinase